MSLRKSFGVAFGVSVAVGSMIGAGILRSPAEVARLLPVPSLFLAAWLAGGLYALLGANALAELGTMVPRSGGQYVFVRRALGPYAGFVVGWNDWISSSGSVAAISLVVGGAAGTLFPVMAPHAVLVAVALVVLVTLVLWRGVRESDRTQRLTSALKALVLLGLVFACFAARLAGDGPLPDPASPPAVPTGLALAAAFILALQGIIYAYDGWTGILYFSEEVHDGSRDIPRSLFLGVVAVIAIYLLLNIAFLAVVSIPALAASPLAAATAARVVFGERGGTIVQALVVLALPSAVVANTLMSSRVAYALGGDGMAPRRFARVNQGGTPGPALIASSAIAMLFLLTGTFERVIAICSFLFVASYTLSFISVFVLRRREPDAPRPYRAWGHPYTTGAILLGSIAFLVGSILADHRTGLLAAALALFSYPAYYLLSRNSSTHAPAPPS